MYKKIMVGYDGTRFSDCALGEAIRLAKVFGTEILLVTVPEINPMIRETAQEINNMLVENAFAALEQAATKAKSAGVACKTEIVMADSAHAGLVDTAEKNKVDLIVVGTYGRTALLRLDMGGTTARVIGHAPCNVLVVRCL